MKTFGSYQNFFLGLLLPVLGCGQVYAQAMLSRELILHINPEIF